MTFPIYSREQLSSFKRPQLWSICDQLALPKHVSNAKCVEEIVTKQSTQIQQVAQAELNVTIEQQAQEVTEITTREITFYDHEVLAGDEVIGDDIF